MPGSSVNQQVHLLSSDRNVPMGQFNNWDLNPLSPGALDFIMDIQEEIMPPTSRFVKLTKAIVRPFLVETTSWMHSAMISMLMRGSKSILSFHIVQRVAVHIVIATFGADFDCH